MTTTMNGKRALRWRALAVLALIPAASALHLTEAQGIPAANAQELRRPSSLDDTDAAAALERWRRSPEAPSERVATLKSRVARKRAHLEKLNQRLREAREAGEGARVSRQAYQALYEASRLAAEEDKLRQAESRAALAAHLDTDQAEALVKREIEAARAARLRTVDRLLREAEAQRPWITEGPFQARLDRLVKSLRSERGRQS